MDGAKAENMVAKGNQVNLQGVAQSVNPTPGDGNMMPGPMRRMPHLHKLEK